MMAFSPVAIAFGIVVVVAVVGVVIALARRRSTFAGYRDIAGDAQKLVAATGGEVFRDHEDLVISGNYKRAPVTIRFSRADETPGLNIRMEAPATFSLYVVPRAGQAESGRYSLRTSDENFDVRYSVRADDPAHARMFLGGRQAFAAVQKLCVAGSTFLTVSPGALELSELAFPAAPAAQRITNLLQGMAELGEALTNMPGAQSVVIRPIRRGSSLLTRAAIAVGVVAAIAGVLAASRSFEGNSERVRLEGGEPAAPGVLPVDAPRISNLSGWRVATPSDFSADAAGWLRSTGVQVSGRIPVDFSGSGSLRDVAYVLANADGERRLVLLAAGETRYDTRFPRIGIVARIPRKNIAAIQWTGQAPVEFEGDGLLLVRTPEDRTSGLVLFIKGRRIISAVPADYQTLNPTE